MSDVIQFNKKKSAQSVEIKFSTQLKMEGR